VGEHWYRCHQLFRQALHRELDTLAASDVPVLLSRAADWFLAQGLVEEAIGYRIDAGDRVGAFDLLVQNLGWFIGRGAMSALLRLGERLGSSVRDPRLYLMLAAAAGQSGRLDRTMAWLRAAEPLIADDSPPLPGWLSLRAWADTTWAVYGVPEDPDAALRYGRRAAELEEDPTRWGYVVARQALAGALRGAGLVSEAIEVLRESRAAPAHSTLPALMMLQGAGQLAVNLVEVGDLDAARRVCAEVADAAAEAERTWGAGAAAAVAILRRAEGRILTATNPAAALSVLHRAVTLAEAWGPPVAIVAALISLAEAQWATGNHPGARLSLDRAREAAEEIPRHFTAQRLRELEVRIGRSAGSAARRRAVLAEELTDRELAVLRALRSPLSAREIGAELYLSINTVKGYKKSLYRKLGVVTREDAVRRGRELGLA
jgi:LuxR family transcriptional regulator, maltose regulon positive regulatory protein